MPPLTGLWYYCNHPQSHGSRRGVKPVAPAEFNNRSLQDQGGGAEIERVEKNKSQHLRCEKINNRKWQGHDSYDQFNKSELVHVILLDKVYYFLPHLKGFQRPA